VGYLVDACNCVISSSSSSSSPSLPPQALYSVVNLRSNTFFLYSRWSLSIACLIFVSTINLILFNLDPLSFSWSPFFPCSFHCSCCRYLGIRWFESFQHDHTILVGGILQYLPLTACVIFFLTTIKLCEEKSTLGLFNDFFNCTSYSHQNILI